MNQHIIIDKKGKRIVQLPLARYKKLMADVAELADIKAYDTAKARLAAGDDEIIPFEIIERRAAGEPALKIWREYRGLTQERLAKKSGVSRPMIAAIEAGTKKGSIATIKALAKTLDIGLENLA